MQIRPYRELNNAVNGAVLTFVDITERKLHEHARSHLAAIVESSKDGIISHDLAGVITSWNAGAELLFGFTAAEAIGQVMNHLLHGPQPEHWPNLDATLANDQPVERFEAALMTKAGDALDVSITISPVREGDGRIVGASVVARDISERKATDRKAELLLGELDHRVKNILAVVSAVVSQTLSSGLTQEAFAVEVEGRIRAVAKAHSLLTHAGNGTLSLRDVIDTELAPYDRNHGHIVVHGPDVEMTPKAGLALAMAIHELTSNAAKYGALSTQQGHLTVISSLSAGDEGMMLSLDWTEAKGPTVVTPTRRGFGTSLIERALAYELDATVTRSFAASGVVCQFLIPLTEEVGHVRLAEMNPS
jgi:two-component system CheB/CheR fusion protein